MSKIQIEYIGKFIRNFLANGDRYDKHCNCQHRKSQVAFRLPYSYLTVANSKRQRECHFDRKYLANGDRQHKQCHCQQMESRIRHFRWHIYLWPWPVLKVKVKVTHLSTVNISQEVKDRANITIAIQYEVHLGLWLAYLDLTLGHSKVKVKQWTFRLQKPLKRWQMKQILNLP